jgi:hypothetical protein
VPLASSSRSSPARVDGVSRQPPNGVRGRQIRSRRLAALSILLPVGFAIAAGGRITETLVLFVLDSGLDGRHPCRVIGYLVGVGAPDETNPGL